MRPEERDRYRVSINIQPLTGLRHPSVIERSMRGHTKSRETRSLRDRLLAVECGQASGEASSIVTTHACQAGSSGSSWISFPFPGHRRVRCVSQDCKYLVDVLCGLLGAAGALRGLSES